MLSSTSIKGDTLRYLIAGVFVTLAGTALLVWLVGLMPYPIAYTIVFIASVLANAFLHSRFVFRRDIKGREILVLSSLCVQYLIGIGGLYVLITLLGINKSYAVIINLFICTPINFIMSRTAFYLTLDSLKKFFRQ